MKNITTYKKGFTIIELLVAAVIIAILAVSISLGFTNALSRSRDARRIEDLGKIKTAMYGYYTDNNTFAITGAVGNWFSDGGAASPAQKLVDGKYLEGVLKDPSGQDKCVQAGSPPVDTCSSSQGAYYIEWKNPNNIDIYGKMEIPTNQNYSGAVIVAGGGLNYVLSLNKD